MVPWLPCRFSPCWHLLVLRALGELDCMLVHGSVNGLPGKGSLNKSNASTLVLLLKAFRASQPPTCEALSTDAY
eukprot:5011433-Amphidinium_carterae.1